MRTKLIEYKWLLVGMLWFICFLNYADRQAISAVFPLLKKEYHFNSVQLALISSAFSYVYAFTAPFAGQVGDRFSRKWVILGGLWVWSIITGFTAKCHHFWQFITVRGAEGLGETFYFPATMSLVSSYHDSTTRSRALSLHQTGVYAGIIFGSTIVASLAAHHGWRFPFMLLGFVGILLGLVLAWLVRDPPGEKQVRTKSSYVEFLKLFGRNPILWLLTIAFFGATFVGWTFVTWMPSYLNEHYHLDLAKSAFGASVFLQTASLIGAATIGPVADYWRRTNPAARMWCQGIGAACCVPFIFACGMNRSIQFLAFAMTCFGFFRGIYEANLWASLYEVIPEERRSSAVGLMNMVGWSGAAMGPVAIGLAMDRGIPFGVSLSSTAIIYVGVACCLFLAGSRFRSQSLA